MGEQIRSGPNYFQSVLWSHRVGTFALFPDRFISRFEKKANLVIGSLDFHRERSSMKLSLGFQAARCSTEHSKLIPDELVMDSSTLFIFVKNSDLKVFLMQRCCIPQT